MSAAGEFIAAVEALGLHVNCASPSEPDYWYCLTRFTTVVYCAAEKTPAPPLPTHRGSFFLRLSPSLDLLGLWNGISFAAPEPGAALLAVQRLAAEQRRHAGPVRDLEPDIIRKTGLFEVQFVELAGAKNELCRALDVIGELVTEAPDSAGLTRLGRYEGQRVAWPRGIHCAKPSRVTLMLEGRLGAHAAHGHLLKALLTRCRIRAREDEYSPAIRPDDEEWARRLGW